MANKFTVENFEEEVLKAELPVFVDFYADWCGPCKMMSPLVDALAEKMEGRLKVGKCNTDENMALAQKYRIATIPTFIIFKDGQPIETLEGVMSPDDFFEQVEKAI